MDSASILAGLQSYALASPASGLSGRDQGGKTGSFSRLVSKLRRKSNHEQQQQQVVGESSGSDRSKRTSRRRSGGDRPRRGELGIDEDVHQKHIDVLFEMILRDLLINEETKRSLISSQSLVQKKKLIQQHTNFRSFHDGAEAGSMDNKARRFKKLVFTGDLNRFKEDLTGLCVFLRTADRAGVKSFVLDSSRLLLNILKFCACKQPKRPEEIDIMKLSLDCLDLVTDNQVGLDLLLKMENEALITLALCIETCPLVVDAYEEVTRYFDESIHNTIVALEILIRLGWQDGSSSRLVQVLGDVGKIHRNIGGPLFLFAKDYVQSGMIERNVCLVLELSLQSFTFLNSLIELEDDINQRDVLRQQIIQLGLKKAIEELIENTKALENETTKTTMHKRKMHRKFNLVGDYHRELETQLEVFENRQRKDLEIFFYESGFNVHDDDEEEEEDGDSFRTAHQGANQQQQPPFTFPFHSPTGHQAPMHRKRERPPAPRFPNVKPPPVPVRPERGRTGSSLSTITSNNHHSVFEGDDDETMWQQVCEFLKFVSLTRYETVLHENGYDTLSRLALLEDDTMKLELNMKPGHIKALRHGLLQWKADQSNRMEAGEEQLNNKNLPKQQHVKLNQPFGFKVIPRPALVIGKLIGRGSFGDVHLCEYQGATCVVKRIRKKISSKTILQEAQANELVKNHPNVVQLYGVSLEAHEIMLVSEFCEAGSLYDVVVKPKTLRLFTLTEVLALARQGVSGLVHLHSLNVVHRDIAARNFLMDSRGIVKVCDFGLAKIKTTNNPYGEGSSTANINPLRWAAPESLTDRIYSAKSDVYMVGVFLWELWQRRTPFADLDNFQAAYQVIHGKRPHVPVESGMKYPELKDLLGSCWSPDAKSRPTMAQVMERLTMLIKSYGQNNKDENDLLDVEQENPKTQNNNPYYNLSNNEKTSTSVSSAKKEGIPLYHYDEEQNQTCSTHSSISSNEVYDV